MGVTYVTYVQAATLHKGMSNKKMANSDKANSWQSHGSQMSYGQSQEL